MKGINKITSIKKGITMKAIPVFKSVNGQIIRGFIPDFENSEDFDIHYISKNNYFCTCCGKWHSEKFEICDKCKKEMVIHSLESLLENGLVSINKQVVLPFFERNKNVR